MNRRREISCDESTDPCEEKQPPGSGYPFAFVLRLRVAQIVCGITTLLMGSVAAIEEKSRFSMGMGIPAGLSTVLAAANSIHCSRGFDGYRPPSKARVWSRLRFLGPTARIAAVQLLLWGLASGLSLALSFDALHILLRGDASSTIGVLAAVECVLSVATMSALVAILCIDLRHDPD